MATSTGSPAATGISTANGGLGDLGQASGGTDVGLTATTIRIAVVADVDSPYLPGLFQATVNAVKAWATLVNEHGGIAGRKVIVDFIDGKSDPNATRNAIISACQNDFAMVGTFALALTTAADIDSCKNSAGQDVGLPDIAASANTEAAECDPMTYTYTGSAVYCDGRGQNPQPYQVQVGEYRYFLSQDPGLNGLMVAASDDPSVEQVNFATWDAAKTLGLKSDGEGVYGIPAASPQAAMTPIIEVAKADQANFIYNEVTSGTIIQLRREAQLQGLTSVKYWVCHIGCYDNEVLASAPQQYEGIYSEMNMLPFYTEGTSNPSLNALITQIGNISQINTYGVDGWIACMLFQDAVVKAAATGTLTRQTLLAALKSTHSETAHGIIGAVDLGNHGLSPCMMLSTVKNGKWVRAYPSQPGTFNCDPANLQISHYSA